jgi:hypothetical protein
MTDATRPNLAVAVLVTVIFIWPMSMIATPVVLIYDLEGQSFPAWAWVLAAIGYPLNALWVGALAKAALTSVS